MVTAPVAGTAQLQIWFTWFIGKAFTFGVLRGSPRSAISFARVGCTLPASSVARLITTAGVPVQFHGIRNRVSALGSTGACSAATAQDLPPSAETSTLAIRPCPDHA